jgi:ribosomal protein L32E
MEEHCIQDKVSAMVEVNTRSRMRKKKHAMPYQELARFDRCSSQWRARRQWEALGSTKVPEMQAQPSIEGLASTKIDDLQGMQC